MKVSVFGTGYVGLVTAICMAKLGHDVVGVDIDENKIALIQSGIMPIYEPGLAELYQEVKHHITFTTDAVVGILHGEVVFNAVGTPPKQDGSANLEYVYAVADTFAHHLNHNAILINKSTVPVGTAKECARRIHSILDDRGVSYTFDVVSNPEFLKEGTAIDDFIATERIVCGYSHESSKKVIDELYTYFIQKNIPILYTDTASSELIKYASNTFLATKISFINELATFAEIVGADILDISKGMGLDSRIGKKFLQAGVGYGGSCFPKDVQALVHTGRLHGFEFKIPQAAQDVNAFQKTKPYQFLHQKFPSLQGCTITIWGAAFKPGTDDTRASPTRELMDDLSAQGAIIRLCDPQGITPERLSQYPTSAHCAYPITIEESLYNADALVLMTAREEYVSADFGFLKHMKTPIVYDGRNMRADRTIPECIDYTGVGR